MMGQLKFKAYRNAEGQTEFLDYLDQLTSVQQQNLCAMLHQTAILGLNGAVKMKWIDSVTTNLYMMCVLQNQTQKSTVYFHVVNDRCLLTNAVTEPVALTSDIAKQRALALRKEFFQQYRLARGLN